MDVYNYVKGGVVKANKIGKTRPVWIDLVSPSDAVLKEVAEQLGLFSFILHHCREMHRPKLEIFDTFVALNFKVCTLKKRLASKQVCLFFSKDVLVTIHSGNSAIKKIQERVERSEDRKLLSDLDYLFYSILDELVETFFPIIEKMEERIDYIEDRVFADPTPKTLEEIFDIKKNALRLHKILWAEREALLDLYKGIPGIQTKNLMYFRDLYDHIIQLVDSEELYRDILTSALDSYTSMISYKLNDIMKVLTVIATIMMPLTLITGIYGMNFKYMPELFWRYGYFGTLIGMGIIGTVMLIYFRKRGWV